MLCGGIVSDTAEFPQINRLFFIGIQDDVGFLFLMRSQRCIGMQFGIHWGHCQPESCGEYPSHPNGGVVGSTPGGGRLRAWCLSQIQASNQLRSEFGTGGRLAQLLNRRLRIVFKSACWDFVERLSFVVACWQDVLKRQRQCFGLSQIQLEQFCSSYNLLGLSLLSRPIPLMCGIEEFRQFDLGEVYSGKRHGFRILLASDHREIAAVGG